MESLGVCTTTLSFSIRTFSLTEEWAVVGAIIARQRQDLFCQICRHDVLVGNFWKFGHADTYKVFVLASQQAGAEWLTSQLTASHTVCSAFAILTWGQATVHNFPEKSQFLIKFLRKPRHQCHTPRLVLLSGRCERSRPSRWICRNGWRTWVSHTGFAVKSSAASSTRRNTCRTRAGSGLAVNIYPVPETKNRSTSVTTLYRHDILEQHTPNS